MVEPHLLTLVGDAQPHLLTLADDAQRAIFTLLSDALRPAVVLNLSACCLALRTVSEAGRTELWRQHSAAKRLCARQGTSCATVRESSTLLWYGAGLTVIYLRTLGQLLSANALAQLEVVNLSINRLGAEGTSILCENLGRDSLPRVRVLDLTSNAFEGKLPDSIGSLVSMTLLSFPDNSVTALPDAIGSCAELKSLHAWNNRLAALPASIGFLTKLTHINVFNNCIRTIAPEIGMLKRVGAIVLGSNELTNEGLPEEICDMSGLNSIHLYRNSELTRLPDRIGDLTDLATLRLFSTGLIALPDSLSTLSVLRELHLADCSALASLPPSITDLTSLTKLDIRGCDLLEEFIACDPTLDLWIDALVKGNGCEVKRGVLVRSS